MSDNRLHPVTLIERTTERTTERPLPKPEPRKPRLQVLRDLLEQHDTLQHDMADVASMLVCAQQGATCKLSVTGGAIVEMSAQMATEFLSRMNHMQAQALAEVTEKLTRAQSAL